MSANESERVQSKFSGEERSIVSSDESMERSIDGSLGVGSLFLELLRLLLVTLRVTSWREQRVRRCFNIHLHY